MKLPSFKRLNKTDFKDEYNDLIDGISFTINSAIESINEALNSNVSLKDNVACTVKDIQVVVKDSTGVLTTKTTVKLNSKDSQVLGVTVINATSLSDNSIPDSGVFLKYAQNGSTVDFTHARGLSVGVKYQLRVVIYV